MNEFNHKDNLEVYIRQKADEHKMYPSDEVWKNVRKQIHTPKKWPALSFFAVALITALVIATVLNKPVPDTVTANFHFSLQTSANDEATQKPADKAVLQNERYSAQQLTSKTIIAAVEKLNTENKIERILTVQTEKPGKNLYFPVILNHSPIPAKVMANNTVAGNVSVQQKNIFSPLSVHSFSTVKNYLFDITSRLKNILNSRQEENHSGGVAFFHSNNSQAFNDFDIRLQSPFSGLIPKTFQQLSNGSGRLDFRFYVTPSVSYRRLDEAKQQKYQPQTSASIQSNANISPSQAIHQNPSIGYETGFGLGYKLTNRLTLTGGLQFNISQYKVDAYLYKNESVVLTLDDGKFSNTINTVSTLRSTPGSTPLTIENRYYQISAPIGIDWLAWNNQKFSFGIAGSLQPTYTFDKQPLIFSSNFKNYADGSNYIRNWNINANLESYFGYTTGSFRWEIGPQLRYQLLPTLVDKYPNHEYLINYGLKIGVVKHL